MKIQTISVSILFICMPLSAIAYSPTERDQKALSLVETKINGLIAKKGDGYRDGLLKQLENLSKKQVSDRNIYLVTHLINSLKKSPVEYELVEVVDGDTVSIIYNGEKTKVRLIGINAPETKQVSYNTSCLWVVAKDYLKSKLNGVTKIGIEFDDTQGKMDSFGRLLGFIFVNGENLNRTLIEQGLAAEYTYNPKKPYKYQREFISANDIAQKSKLGLYSDTCLSSVKNTDSVSVQTSGSGTSQYVWNGQCLIKWNINWDKTKIYHLPSCKDYKKTVIDTTKWENFFCSEQDAVSAGFRRAETCE